MIKTAALAPIVDFYAEKDMELSELQEVADLITAEFKRRGYTLARAYIPEQEIKDGIVEIAVLEGRIGEIVVKGNKNYSTDFIKRVFMPVVEERAIKHASLEKSLLLLNENPDLKVTAVLQAGKEAGTTDIVVNVEDKLPLHFSIDYNNFGTESVSKHRFGAELNLGRFLPIEGSSLSLRGVVGSDPRHFHYERASYGLPVNSYGTKLGLFGFGGNFDVGRELADLNITGKTWGYGISLAHPFVKTRFQNLIGEFGFESKDAKEFLLGSLSSRDKLRMLKIGLNYDRIDSTGRNFISFAVFQGLGEALGAMEDNDPKTSRAGADNKFTKAYLNLARVQRVGDYFSIIFRGSGQASTDSLVSIEQFSIGGADSVRGYPQGEFLGDDGYNVSTELRVSPWPNEIAQVAFFVDNGGVSVKNPPTGTKKYRHLTGVGYGLRLSLPYNLTVRFDLGFPVQPSKTSSGERPVGYVQGAVTF